jgi:hypothetical protein
MTSYRVNLRLIKLESLQKVLGCLTAITVVSTEIFPIALSLSLSLSLSLYNIYIYIYIHTSHLACIALYIHTGVIDVNELGSAIRG